MKPQTPLATYIRGRHAASDNMIIVKDEATGKNSVIKNLDTRITPDSTEIVFLSACEGSICLRVEDKKHSDFWIEFNLDISTLQRLLDAAKGTLSEPGQ